MEWQVHASAFTMIYKLLPLSGGQVLLNLYGEWGYYRLLGLPLNQYLKHRGREILATYVAKRFGQPQP